MLGGYEICQGVEIMGQNANHRTLKFRGEFLEPLVVEWTMPKNIKYLNISKYLRYAPTMCVCCSEF